jgi:putative FmdB family regulatory protein
MPFYEYRCAECGAEFEKMLRFSEADQLPACPKCESPKTQKSGLLWGGFGRGQHFQRQQLRLTRRLFLSGLNLQRPCVVLQPKNSSKG